MNQTSKAVRLRHKNDVVFTVLPPLSLYVHIPWCVRKCPYCDFNSHVAPPQAKGAVQVLDPALEQAYIDALILDLDSALPLIWGRPVRTVFFGGGTPSLLSGAGLDRLLGAIRARVTLLPEAEITLEANPGAIDLANFEAYAQAGVNRISIGVQSFNDRSLKALGRVHDSNQAREALSAAQKFARFNLDLMFGLPGQTLAQVIDELDQALSFDPSHLSIYQLTLEPGTAFAARPPVLPDDDLCADMQAAVVEHLAAAGLMRYEVSAYATTGAQSRHNLNYWRFGDYVGIGAGAHGKLSFPDHVLRQSKVRQPAHYIEQVSIQRQCLQHSVVAAAELPFEFMLNALRLTQGVDSASFSERTGLPWEAIARPVAEASQRGWLVDDPRRLQATPLGYRFLNDLQSLFLP